MESSTPRGAEGAASNFIRDIIDRDLASGRHRRVVTRFPPEPNGYLHIGHAKSICLNFGLAGDYGGVCNLRYDDTNPETEEIEYVESIQESIRWLGFDWQDRLFFASDYFGTFYEYALKLIRAGDAYVDSLNEEEIRAYRGTVTAPGRPSPHRDRSVEENLDLFERMRRGEFAEGAHVLRAKIDLASPNMKMRDPLLYRIKHAHHYRTGGEWHVYPMYDFAHPLEDAIERVTHSLCTLEFDNNRELYDWVLEHCLEPDELPGRPRQYEFSRLRLDYTVMSKRKLLQLVNEGLVDGWDDPRMPTLFGMRRRGVPPEAVRAFCDGVGVTKTVGTVDPALLEHAIRDELNFRAPRVMCVLHPLRVVLTNYPEGEVEWLDAPYWPHDVGKEGTRKVPFSRTLYIERDDFMEDPPRKFFRLAPGREVRLRYGYFITCREVVKDARGEIVELRCSYDPATRGGDAPDGRSPKATLHWVSADHALPAEARLYDRLFRVPDPDAGEADYRDNLNPESLVVVPGARVEPGVADDPADTRYQFERQGYFWRDPKDSRPDRLVFNRIVGLRDSWAKIAASAAPERKEEPQPARPALATETAPAAEREDPAERLDPAARERFARLAGSGLPADDALYLAEREAAFDLFHEALAERDEPRAVANWTIQLLREARDTPVDMLPVTGGQIARLVALLSEGTISSRIAREVIGEMLQYGRDPDEIIRARGLTQVSDRTALEAIADRLLRAHPEKAEQYRSGKTGLMGFFVGQAMRETGGRANPALLQEVMREKLEG